MVDFTVEVNKSFASHPIVSIVVVCQYTYDNKSPMYCFKLNGNYPFTVLHDFAYDFIRKLMFCSTNFRNKKED